MFSPAERRDLPSCATVALVFPDTFGWFQLKCREAVCIPEGKACETDTALLVRLRPLGMFVFSTRGAR